MPKLALRPLTWLLLAAAAVCIAVGIVYFTTAAKDLPGFVPGHEAGSTHRHIKHGLAMVGVAILALIGAWLTTAPDNTKAG